MSDSQTTDVSDLEELDFSASGLYDDDLSEDAVLITPFEVSTGTSGKLSSRTSREKSVDPDSTCEEVGETYTQMISHSRVRAALKRPIRLRKFLGAPACLMVLEIVMDDTTRSRQMRRLLRFKAMDISAKFEDAGGLFRLDPEIVMFCPEEYTGEPTVVKHAYSNTAGASIDVSGGLPVGATVGIHRHHNIQFTEKCNVSIAGSTLRMDDKTTIVKWQLNEDRALRQGMPKQLRFAIAVSYPEERAFTMKLNFMANLGFNDVEFKVRNRQSVLAVKIDPRILREQALNDEHGLTHGQAWHCKTDDTELTPLDLEKGTNLRGATVGCTSCVEEEEY